MVALGRKAAGANAIEAVYNFHTYDPETKEDDEKRYAIMMKEIGDDDECPIGKKDRSPWQHNYMRRWYSGVCEVWEEMKEC